MDAAPTAPSAPVRRARLLKVAVVVPDLLISGLLWLMCVALLPTEVAVGFLAGMLAISWVVGSGRAEGLAVRIMYAARRPTPFEAGRLDAPLRWSPPAAVWRTSASWCPLWVSRSAARDADT